MQLRYELETGWPNQLTAMNRRIGGLKRHASAIKVGITNCPETRLRQYETTCPRHYSEMVVLYRTSTRRNAAEVERRQIARNGHDRRLRNERGGGGGRPGKGAYYLYVVRRRRRFKS